MTGNNSFAICSTRHLENCPKKKPQKLLFNVVDDIACENNVAADHPEIVAKLEKIADGARADLGDQGKEGAGQRKPGRVETPVPQVMR